jgi:hypothetical protein
MDILLHFPRVAKTGCVFFSLIRSKVRVKPDVRILRQDFAPGIGHAEGHHGVEFLKESSKIKPNVNFSLLYPAPP